MFNRGEENVMPINSSPGWGRGNRLHTGSKVTQAKGRSIEWGFSGSDPGLRLGRGVGKGIKDQGV